MAKDKKSFIAYVDWKDTFDALPDEKAGQLIKHIYSYVSDENPKTDDVLINAVFANIKNALKRDLKTWEKKQEQRSKAGKRSAEVRKQNATTVNERSIPSTVSVNGNGNGNVGSKLPIYLKSDFLLDWNELRTKHLKKPSHANSFGGFEAESNFNKLKKDYSRDEIKNGMIGLFRQKKLPNGNTMMQSNPKHFLSHFESYHQAFYDKNENLYGKE